MNLDPEILARIQFAANISFHIIFPTISLALVWVLFAFKLAGPAWKAAYRFWVKVFALSFALGVVSGVTMSFQFGTNWPGFMETVGNVAGPLLAYEVLTAFFLEATFLGIMLFGQQRVSSRVHTLATFLVAVGTTMSAFWILALNSWMQTPAGYELVDGVVVVRDWWEVVFNPSFPYRLVHMLIASALTGCFLIAGICAYKYLLGRRDGQVMKPLRAVMIVASILAPTQVLVGDFHGLNTLKYQPEKIAAIEAIWETQTRVPLVLFAIPDQQLKQNRYAIELPGVASLVLGHSFDAELKGLNSFSNTPPVLIPFFGFRLMVGLGVLMLVVAPCVVWYTRSTKSLPIWLAKLLVGMTFSGSIATLAGWYVTEVGRQPWLVRDILLVKDAVGPITQGPLLSSLIMYLSLYVVLLAAFVWTLFYLARSTLDRDTVPTAFWRPRHDR